MRDPARREPQRRLLCQPDDKPAEPGLHTAPVVVRLMGVVAPRRIEPEQTAVAPIWSDSERPSARPGGSVEWAANERRQPMAADTAARRRKEMTAARSVPVTRQTVTPEDRGRGDRDWQSGGRKEMTAARPVSATRQRTGDGGGRGDRDWQSGGRRRRRRRPTGSRATVSNPAAAGAGVRPVAASDRSHITVVTARQLPSDGWRRPSVSEHASEDQLAAPVGGGAG